MRTRTKAKPFARAVLGGLLGVVLVFAAGAAFAQDDDDDDTFEQKIIKNIMRGMGADTRDSIDFRERSPLVIPPSRDLPPPQDATKVNDPAWPKDPEKRKQVKKAKPFVNGSIAEQNMVSPERAPMISPEALRNGAIPGSDSQRVTTPEPNQDVESNRNKTPTELGFPGWGSFSNLFGYKAEQQPFTSEPARTNLIEPPAGYQTPSPNYPYGIGAKGNNTVKDLPIIKDRAVGAEGQ